MFNTKKYVFIFSLLFFFLGFKFFLTAMPAGSRITLPNGKKIFVSGMNLAWKNYANDVGDTPLDTAYYNKAMKDIADSGGNCMRIWLSTDGTKDPKYGSNGLVTGPASQTIPNIQKMLNIASKNKIKLILVLLTHNWVNKNINPTILENNKKMLKTEEGLNAYISNYLIPVVKAVGAHQALLCWEIYNEPEGMVDGWSSPKNTITKEEVQRSVNWISAAIRENVPDVLISNGAATISTLSWYTDNALKSVGGKEKGYLDFYMAHYYGWNGTSNSPFTRSYASLNLDKPLVIGEYASSSWSQSTSSSNPMQDAANVDTLMYYLYNAGYAGGLGWQYQQDAGDPWMKGFTTFSHSMMVVYRTDSNAIKIDGENDNTFAVIFSAGNGGTVKASTTGRIAAGKSDTLTAIPAKGYTFSGWTGDTTSSDSILIIKNISKDWIVQANFTPEAGTNLIKAGDFSDPTQWSFWADKNNGNEAEVSFTNQQAIVTIKKSDSLNYHIQLTQGGIELDSGIAYIISFDAWSTGERNLFVGLNTEGTWHFQGGGVVELTDNKKTFQIEITPDSSTTAGILQFNCGGGSLLPIYIDNVVMTKKNGTFVTKNCSNKFKQRIVFANNRNFIIWDFPSQAEASIIDLGGRCVIKGIKDKTVDIKKLSNGVYVFSIKSKNEKFSLFFVK